MKEDILEQLIDDYLQSKGYFTIHNIKYKPDIGARGYIKDQDSVHSDLDVIGINPKLRGPNKVVVVNCKSTQNGFNPSDIIKRIRGNKKLGNKPAWKHFRELVNRKWNIAMFNKIFSLTGTKKFMHITAVAFIVGNKIDWENSPITNRYMRNNPVKVLTFKEMVLDIFVNIGKTPCNSQFTRTLQLMKASKIALR